MQLPAECFEEYLKKLHAKQPKSELVSQLLSVTETQRDPPKRPATGTLAADVAAFFGD